MKNSTMSSSGLLAHLRNSNTVGYLFASGESEDGRLIIEDINSAALTLLMTDSEELLVGQELSDFLSTHFDFRRNDLESLRHEGVWEKDIELRADDRVKTLQLSLHYEETEQNEMICSGILTSNENSQNSVDESEKLLQATATANTLLLEVDSLENAIFEAFKVIGEATRVDRVYIFENYENSRVGKLYCKQRMEWSRSSVTPQIDNEDLQKFPLEEAIPRWYSTLKAGGTIQGLVKDFPPEEREVLEPQDIVSLLVIPVTINEDFWGFIGFDDCSKNRSWNRSEIAILKALASNLGLRYERHRIETELKQSRTVFQQIADTIDEVFYVADHLNNVVYVNSAIERVFDIKQKELLSDLSVFNNRILEEDLETVRQHISKNSPAVYDFRFNHPDGTLRDIAAKRFPVLDENGAVKNVIGVLRDVTEIKRAQKEMQANLEKEHELLELKNNFISMISHEIRTPITTIISTAEMLRDFVSRMEEEKRNEMIDRVLGASHTIVNLLEEVLFIGKQDAIDSEEQEVAEVDIEQVIEEIIDENRYLDERENIVKTSYQLKLNPVPIDENLIWHIMNNLIDNASKYSDIRSEINIRVESRTEELRIVVKDKGIGMYSDDLAKIFDPFFRSKRVSNKEGTGIGMAVVKRAVDSLDGSIEIDSAPDKGTAVRVILPFQ